MLLRHYVRVMWHWLWLILLGTIVCAGITYQIVKHMTPTYEADALVLVNGTPTSSADYNNILSSQALAQSYSLLMTDPVALATVAKTVPGVTVHDLEKTVTVFPAANTQLIDVRAQAPTAREAATIANTVATVFIQREQANETAQLSNIAAPIQAQMAQAQATMNSADAQLTALEHSVYYYYSPAQQQQITGQIAQQQQVFDLARSNYETLLQSYNTLHIAQLQIPYTLGLAQSAAPPVTPKSPQVLLSVAIATAMGLLLMVVLVLLLDRLNTTIKTPEDVANLAGLEPLGSVPSWTRSHLLANVLRVPGASSAHEPTTQTTPDEQPDERIGQAFLAIGTNLCALRRGRRIFLITSLRRRAGVSMTANKLALALAQSGVRVLHIDANFRWPTQQDVLQRDQAAGLASTLLDMRRCQAKGATLPFLDKQNGSMESWLEQWRTDVPGLWVMPSGLQPVPDSASAAPGNAPSAAPRMGIPEMRALIEAIASSSRAQSGKPGSSTIDMILLDAPALNQGAEAIALTTVADAAILVTRAGTERPEAFHRARATFDRLGCPVLGVIVNGQRAGHQPYYFVDAYREASEPVYMLQPTTPAESQWLLVRPASQAPIGASVLAAQQDRDTLEGVVGADSQQRYRNGRMRLTDAAHSSGPHDRMYDAINVEYGGDGAETDATP